MRYGPKPEQFKFFETLVGFEYDFYGVDCNTFCLGLGARGRVAFEAIEDLEDNCNKSSLGTIIINSENKLYFKTPIARVRLEKFSDDRAGRHSLDDYGEFIGWQLVDVTDNHVWLRFGTDNCNDYYPYFMFNYMPKKTLENKENK